MPTRGLASIMRTSCVSAAAVMTLSASSMIM
jgi:hypothetical protein